MKCLSPLNFSAVDAPRENGCPELRRVTGTGGFRLYRSRSGEEQGLVMKNDNPSQSPNHTAPPKDPITDPRRGLHRRITSHDVRAWCEEWALPPAFLEIALTTYACAQDDAEVLACLRRLASAQQKRLLREGRLISLAKFLRSPEILSAEVDPDWNPVWDDVVERLFGRGNSEDPSKGAG